MTNDNPKKILLVEDEAIIAMMEKNILEKYGYNVIHANTGENAVRIVQAESGIDLILMDIDLGRGMDGTEAAEMILREHDLPLVFLSSHIEPEIVEKTEGITSYGYIVKNTGETVLIASIKMAFRLFEVKKKDEAKEKELFLQSLILDQIHDNVTVTDFAGNIMYVNSAVVDMVGRSREQILNQSIEIYGEDSVRGATQKEILETTLQDGSWQGEVVNFKPDGEARILHSRTQIIHDQHGNPIALCGVSSDVTAQKLTEERMRVMSEMLDNAPSSITVHDSSGVFLYANRKTFDVHGYEEADFMSKNLREIDIPESDELFAERIKQIDENGEASFEVGHYRRDGSVLSLEVVAKKVNWGGQPAILSIATDITERKRIEGALNEKTRLLQNITDNMFDLVALTDPQGFFKFVGRSHQILGYDLDSLIGRNAMDFVHPDDLPNISAAFEDSMTTGKDDRKAEYRYLCADGSYIWLETVGRFINDENRNVVELLFSSRDVTDRKKVEESLRESEQKYRFIFENSPLGLLHFDSEGIITACNDNFVSIIGSSREALVGLNMCTLPDNKIVAAVRDSLEGCNGFYEDYYHSVTASKVTPIRALFTSIRDSEGDFLGGTGIIEDITERRKTEDALRESEERYRLLFQYSPLGIYIADREGNILDANERLLTILGSPSLEATKKINVMKFPVLIESGYSDAFRKCVDSNTIVSMEFSYTSLWGKTTFASNYLVPVADDAGKVVKVFTLIEDITTRKQNEERIKSLLNEKELLLKETHHRIKNNMNVVHSLLLLQANRMDDGAGKEILDDAAGRVQSMAILYDKLYRSDIQHELSMKDFLPSLIEDIIAVTPGAVPVKTDIRIEDIVVSAKILSSLGILLNELIANSMKHAFKDLADCLITISAEKKDDKITITYSDNGVGLPEVVTPETSTGFGMQLISMLVRQIKGTVEIIRDHGTGFVIRF